MKKTSIIRRIVSLLLVLSLLAGTTSFASASTVDPRACVIDEYGTAHYYTEFMTDEEILSVIDMIADGEDVIFGDGANDDLYSAHLESIGISPAWAGVGANKTHQWITARAFSILGNDKPGVIAKYQKFAQDIGTVVDFSDWPDKEEKNDTNSWHFYHYPTKTNFWGDSSPTAKSRFMDYYNSALNYYNSASLTRAFEDLGKAIHYLSDLGTPVHTGDHALGLIDLATQFIKHGTYENYADAHKNTFSIFDSGFYTQYTSNSLDTIAENVAVVSFSYYSGAQSSEGSLAFVNAVRYPLEDIQRGVAGLLYKFYIDTGNLRYN